MNYPTTELVSAKLEQYARTIAPYVAFVLALAVQTYHLGRLLGRWVHSTNDLLAANWPTRPRASTTGPLAQVIAETGTTITTATITTAAVLELYAQGLSQRAIAAQLGCSRATVRRRMAATA